MTEQPTPSPVAVGELIAGKYRVERVLGAGGMGIVLAAHHVVLDERVAIKLLLPEATTNPDAVERFAREARSSVKIKNEHVARTLDVGQLENGTPYIVMEFLEGQDLGMRLSSGGALPWEQVIRFGLDACEALADAHALGIIHRDLKPANLFVVRKSDGTESIKVLDFGISKQTTGTTDVSMTRTSTLMGSPLYMSPEQMASAKTVDRRSDIWSLGVTLYELLAGVPPFQATTITELCAQVLTTSPPSLRTARPDLPAGLEDVVGRCLTRDPAARYQNVAELALALAAFGPQHLQQDASRVARILGITSLAEPIGLQQPAAAVPVGATTTPELRATQSATSSSWSESGGAQLPRPRYGRWALVAVLVTALAGAGLAGYRWMRPKVAPELAARPLEVSQQLPTAARSDASSPIGEPLAMAGAASGSAPTSEPAVVPVVASTQPTAVLQPAPKTAKTAGTKQTTLGPAKTSAAKETKQPLSSDTKSSAKATGSQPAPVRSLRDYGGRKY